MQNDPMGMLVNAINAGQNPMAALQMMAGLNPQLAQAVQMLQGKSPAQLQQMAQNMARERGISINDLIRQLGINNTSYK